MVTINMPIPDTCSECRLSVRHFGKIYCPYIADRVGNEGKDSRCPLVDAEDRGDLISRQDALSCFHDWIDRHGDVHTADEMPEYQRIEQLPSAQPEIIRCKDCKWYELPNHKITENCVRWMKSNGILLPIKPNDYCSYAERRTDERSD